MTPPSGRGARTPGRHGGEGEGGGGGEEGGAEEGRGAEAAGERLEADALGRREEEREERRGPGWRMAVRGSMGSGSKFRSEGRFQKLPHFFQLQFRQFWKTI